MTTTPLAQAGLAGTVGWYAIVFIVVIAIVGIAYVVARAAGVTPPGWLLTIGWIVIAAVVGVLAIKLLLSVL